jgi:hypothetical protein
MLWYLTEAARLCPPSAPQLSSELATAIRALDAMAATPLRTAQASVNVAAHERATRSLLRRLGAALGGPSARRRLPVLAGARPAARESLASLNCCPPHRPPAAG